MWGGKGRGGAVGDGCRARGRSSAVESVSSHIATHVALCLLSVSAISLCIVEVPLSSRSTLCRHVAAQCFDTSIN